MKILLASDGSDYSRGAAEFLTCLDLTSQDEITVFHAVNWIPFLYDSEYYAETFNEIKKELAPRIIDTVVDILRPVKARISTAIVEGGPAQSILDRIEASDTDMAVLGARGIKGLESLFVGSVARVVAIKSPRPVLVTRQPVCDRTALKVLYATDGSEHSVGTGKFLTSIPFPHDTQITVLNVYPSRLLDIPETFLPEIDKRIVGIKEQAESMRLNNSRRIAEEAKANLIGTFNNVRVMSESGETSEEILRVSEEMKADLIVVGCRGLTGIKGIMGSVSRHVFDHSKCSVLIGKTCAV